MQVKDILLRTPFTREIFYKQFKVYKTMNNCVRHNKLLVPVRINRNRPTIILARQVFLAILLLTSLGSRVSGQSATTTIITANNNPSCLNDVIKLTATVDQPSATGNVQFFEGSTVLGNAFLDNSGVATLTISNLAAGPHSARRAGPRRADVHRVR